MGKSKGTLFQLFQFHIYVALVFNLNNLMKTNSWAQILAQV